MDTDILVFLDSLYERCRLPGYLTFSALDPNKARPTPSKHVPLHDKQKLIATLQEAQGANDHGWGICIGIAPRCANLGRWRRGTKDELTELPALFVDVDKPLETIQQLPCFPLPPTSTVKSGYGTHLYWNLALPTQDFCLAEQMLHGLAEHFGGDSLSCAQSLRLVETRNTKRNRDGALCQLFDFHPERRYDLTQFMPYLAQPPQPKKKWITRSPGTFSWEQAHEGDLNPDLVQDISDCLLSDFRGRRKANGWIASLCPTCDHKRDYPGSHFQFSPTSGYGRCWGHHGSMLLKDLCYLLHLDISRYGWIIKKSGDT